MAQMFSKDCNHGHVSEFNWVCLTQLGPRRSYVISFNRSSDWSEISTRAPSNFFPPVSALFDLKTTLYIPLLKRAPTFHSLIIVCGRHRKLQQDVVWGWEKAPSPQSAITCNRVSHTRRTFQGSSSVTLRLFCSESFVPQPSERPPSPRRRAPSSLAAFKAAIPVWFFLLPPQAYSGMCSFLSST